MSPSAFHDPAAPLTALVLGEDGAPPQALLEDLDAVGVHVLGAVERRHLVREVARLSPAVVVGAVARPDEALLQAVAALRLVDPVAVVLFTEDPEVERIEHALASGVHAYEVHGYARQRLRAVLQTALVRARREAALQQQLEELESRFEERKVVERAKGLLMRAQAVSEDEAYRALRSAAQRTRRPVGQLSRQVVDAARDAEAVNRAGQLRMLAQRVVKLEALRCAGIDEAGATALLQATQARVEDNLALLRRSLSAATYGDLIETVARAAADLEAARVRPVADRAAHLDRLDRLAEALVAKAEQLTLVLQSAGLETPLKVVNLSGRQRMLSQRLVKQVLLAGLLQGAAADAARAAAVLTMREFEQALGQLQALPLSTPGIAERLAQAQAVWHELLAACERGESDAGRQALATHSERLLVAFDQLTNDYERGLQVLLG